MGSAEVFENKKKVFLDRNSYEDLLPSEQVVYVIFAKFAKESGSNETLNCLYVGEAEDMLGNFKRHFSEREPNTCLKHFLNKCGSIMVFYDPVPGSSEESRSRICRVLNKRYEPQCNAPD